MLGNAAAERWALEQSYEERADIYRVDPLAMGAVSRQRWVLLYQGVPCALSRRDDGCRGDGSRQTFAQQDIRYNALLFAAPEWNILPGDTVVLRRGWGEERFAAMGRSARYATHQEVFLKGRDLA